MQAIETLKTAKPGTYAKIVMATTPKTTKKHRETGESFAEVFPAGVVKRTTSIVRCNADYESCVNRIREREGHPEEFRSLGLPGWVDVDHAAANWPVYRHAGNGTEYIRLHAETTLATVYTDDAGNPLTERQESLIGGFLPKPRSDSGRQETEKAVRPIGPKLESIVAVSYASETVAA